MLEPIFPLMDERTALTALLHHTQISVAERKAFKNRATQMVEDLRKDGKASMMELFLGEYGLSTDEGVALMCLAEALLRVPDGDTMDALIEDKIAPSEWGQHLGQSHSSLVNASTWALFVTGKVLDDEEGSTITRTLRGLIKRVGEPVIRQAVARIMREMGNQFVLGETIEKATNRAKTNEAIGYTYSYDMLGEAAKTHADAERYFDAYRDAIRTIGQNAHAKDMRDNPGISIKLSALYPRYEVLKTDDVLNALVPQLTSLAEMAMNAGIGLNVDAEEAGRLSLSLMVIERVLSQPQFKHWTGFGVVVQAYALRAPAIIDWLYNLAQQRDIEIMVRLVKGAYWDTEIKHAQIEGLDHYPVFTQKPSTDVSYIACAEKLLGMSDRIYPQFATHNAHTVSAILELAQDKNSFEFQRLHGMGESLHERLIKQEGARSRIYAPVGRHKDLLAYLVRRLLENGANSSFVNQLVDEDVPPSEIAADPFAEVESYLAAPENIHIRQPKNLFAPHRQNSRGWDLEDMAGVKTLDIQLKNISQKTWDYTNAERPAHKVLNPTNGAEIGAVGFVTIEEAKACIEAIAPWRDQNTAERAAILRKAADLYEAHSDTLFSLLMREAGKTLLDCVAELREAVDFLRYYALQAEKAEARQTVEPLGIVTCISPWNLPLAIFTGQIAAALSMGNGVLAKPAEATSLIAHFATDLLYQAGVPKQSLILLPGEGHLIGQLLVSHPKIDGVCFTGSTQTAQRINRSMAENLQPHAPLIAETGGLNAMIVDSTALLEQAVTDVIASSFQSAGQRCSALRMLYVQEDIVKPFQEMLFGAMDALTLGNPEDFTTDIGPVIDKNAQSKILQYIENALQNGQLLHQINCPSQGNFVPPTVLKLAGIEALDEEIFGPVLHLATYKANQLEMVLDHINAKGFGLTFGFHSRIDDRIETACAKIRVGNIYINRNQIGAVVESQPFGGEGLSGTGPKAGGPKYVNRFRKIIPQHHEKIQQKGMSAPEVEAAFNAISEAVESKHEPRQMIGPTGESNQYYTIARRRVLCLGPTMKIAEEQAKAARQLGCQAIIGHVDADIVQEIKALDAVIYFGENAADFRKALAQRDGLIVPLLTDLDFAQWLVTERHICIDTTAAGGNAQLLNA